jgi:hypothetical protein
MTDLHVYFNRPTGKEGGNLDDLKETLGNLEHVSELRFGSVWQRGRCVVRGRQGGAAGDRGRCCGSRLRGLQDFRQEHLQRSVEPVGYLTFLQSNWARVSGVSALSR